MQFELDVDGNSFSGRFQRLLLSGVVVLKATIFPQFWRDTAIPWLHYVPVQVRGQIGRLADSQPDYRSAAVVCFALTVQ